jgi:hypothetical protein
VLPSGERPQESALRRVLPSGVLPSGERPQESALAVEL